MAVPHTVSFAELMTAFTEAGHSRLPVYEGELDTITGMIHVKDVFARAQAGDHPADISSLVRVPLFVPESMGVLDLLARMRAQRIHLAIVVDEFGGTEGLVTIEDVSRRSSATSRTSMTTRTWACCTRWRTACGTPTRAPSWKT
jgi:CBS domain containing-hemolysin-like protein